jgi:tetratricopeptide (TPR) repeat protein
MNGNFLRSKFFIFALITISAFLIGSRLGRSQQTEPQSGPQEELIPEEMQQQKWTEAFQNAEKVFNSENQADCIPMFQDLITQITQEKMKRPLTDAEKLFLLRSLDYLGQAFFLEEQPEQARGVFTKLIELEPNYKMNEDLVSPKIVDFVNKLREESLGILSVTSDPAGATIKIDGNAAGTTNVASLYTLKGAHDLEISKSGFFLKKDSINVVPGKTVKLNYKLDRSSSVAYFVTYPKGIELVMNGKSLGVTAGDQPSERSQRVATEQNLPAADFSAEFPVAELQPGAYEIEFRKPCWERQVRKITIDKNDDFYFEPIVMVPSFASLNITADDPKANIFIDNAYIGLAPRSQLQVCSGKHVVKIKGPLGKFEKQVELKKDESLAIDAKLHPSLAFLGVSRQGTPSAEVNAQVLEKLANLTTLNLQDNTDLQTDASTTEKILQILTGIASARPDRTRKTQIQELSSKVESDLLLVGREHSGEVDFYLLSNWSSMPDVRTVRLSQPEDWTKFKDQLDSERSVFEKRMGVNLIDTSVTPGPVIARVVLKTFDDAQPLTPGDILVGINNQPVKTVMDALEQARRNQETGQMTLSIQRSGATITIPVKMVNSAVEVPIEDAALLYNRQMASFKKIYNLSINPLEKSLALLNIGLSYMHFGEFEDALDQFRQIDMDRSIGIGPGTVKYRMAVCYNRIGEKKEALDSLSQAARFGQNTLLSDDGFSVALEAEQVQKSLQ